MASKIADVEIQIRAQTAVLEKDLAKGKANVNRFAKEIEVSFLGTGKSIEKAFAALRSTPVIAGLSALGAAFGVATKKALDFASEIVDTAGNLGITTDALQELRFAASQSGVSVETLDTALKFLNKNQSEAASGNKAIADAFRRLGVSVSDAAGELKSTDELFTEVIGRIGELRSPAERTAISMKLLGRSGSELGKLAREGAAGIEALRLKARDLGLVIDEKTLVAAEKAGDKFDALFDVLKVRGVAAILELTPLLDKLSTALLTAAESAGKLVTGLTETEKATAQLSALKNTLKDLEDTNFLGLNDQPIADIERRIAEANRKLALLQFGSSTSLPGTTPRNVGGGPGGSDRLLAPRDEAALKASVRAAEKEAARAAREEAERSAQAQRESAAAGEKVIDLAERRLQAEIRLAEAAGDTDAANEKRVELIQRRFEIERAEILRTVQDAEISQRALEDLGATRDAQLAEVAADATDAFTELKDFAIDGLSDALADLAITGELTFKSLGEAFLREFIQVAIKEGVAKLGKALAGLDAGGAASGGAGFLSLFGLASGGVVTKPTIAMIGEAGPEAVIPLDRLGSGGGKVEITINNNGSGQARLAREERSGRDVKLLFEIVDAEFADRASRGGSKFVKTLTQNFGLNRRGERNG